MSMRCEADHRMKQVGTVRLDPQSVAAIQHLGARDCIESDWMRWDVWRCDECAETQVHPTEGS